MVQEIAVYRKCVQCNGTGFFEPSGGIDAPILVCTWPGCVNGYILFERFSIDPGLDEIISLIEGIAAEQVSQREDLTVTLTNIINEQASQRVDLTAALTQIWNKVNSL